MRLHINLLSSADRTVAITDRDIGSFTQIALARVDCIGTEDNINKCPKASSGFCPNPGAGVICPHIGTLLSIASYQAIHVTDVNPFYRTRM